MKNKTYLQKCKELYGEKSLFVKFLRLFSRRKKNGCEKEIETNA